MGKNNTVLSLIGNKKEMEKTMRKLINLREVTFMSALNELRANRFDKGDLEQNIELAVEMSKLRHGIEIYQVDQKIEMLKKIEEVLQIELKYSEEYLKNDYKIEEVEKEVDEVVENILNIQDTLSEIVFRNEELKKFEKNFVEIQDWDTKIEDLDNLEYFSYKIGIIEKEQSQRLRKNYEKVSAVAREIAKTEDYDVYIMISPKQLELETNRILNSLNFKEINIPKKYRGTPREILESVKEEQENCEGFIKKIRNDFEQIKAEKIDIIKSDYSKLFAQQIIETYRDRIAVTDNFFFVSVLITKKDKVKLLNGFRKEEIHMVFKNKKNYMNVYESGNKKDVGKKIKNFLGISKEGRG